MTTPQEATYITLKATPGKEEELSKFLISGAAIVKETEPDTLLWSALQLDGTTFAIFDTYPHPAGRDAHFAGKVAATLNEKAPELVQGGWEQGVLENVENPKVLASKVAPVLPEQIQKAMFIRLTANPGKEEELANFLIDGAAVVEATEPKTLYWFALQIDEKTFGIFDFFSGQSGIDAHFAGKVAAALNEKAPELIQGGWEQGVLENIKQLDVLTVIAQ